jgi:tetratricopeptide (TPR) repeat protein
MEETTLQALIDLVKNFSSAGKRYCFILGAGASRASGIKTGAEMAKIWLEEMEELEKESTEEWIKSKKINKNNPGADYPKIYGRRFRLDPAYGFTSLQNEMKDAIPSPGYYHLAKILVETGNNLVITTNFDSLTEDSLFIYTDTKALVITHESLAKYIDAFANRPTVIKLHRDLLLQPKNDEAAVNNLSNEWKESLRKIMEIYVPIVIGYGGNDGSFMGFMEEVASKDRNLYWCYKTGSSVNERIKALLEKYHSFSIPIDDFDDTMLLFGKAFGFDFSEKIIQNVTNKRAEKLIDKYNELTGNRFNILKETGGTLSSTESMTYDYLKSTKKKNIGYLESQIDKNPQNADYYYDLGKEYFNNDQYDKADECLTEAIRLNPYNAKYYHLRGKNYNWVNAYEKAVADCSKAIELEPDNAEYYNSRGINYNWLNQTGNAVEDLSKAIELDPNNALYYTRLARVLYRAGNIDRVLDNLNKALSLNNNLPEYYNVRGYIKLKTAKRAGDTCDVDALNDLNKAVELKKDSRPNFRFYTDRAEYYLYSGNLDNAYNDLHKALDRDSRYGRAYYFLAKYYEAKGNKREYENSMAKSKEYRFIPNDDD